jgi:hypothetical protein
MRSGEPARASTLQAIEGACPRRRDKKTAMMLPLRGNRCSYGAERPPTTTLHGRLIGAPYYVYPVCTQAPGSGLHRADLNALTDEGSMSDESWNLTAIIAERVMGFQTSLGGPRRVFRRDEAVRLRTTGVSWWKIAQLLDVPMSTVIDSCRKGVDSCGAASATK